MIWTSTIQQKVEVQSHVIIFHPISCLNRKLLLYFLHLTFEVYKKCKSLFCELLWKYYFIFMFFLKWCLNVHGWRNNKSFIKQFNGMLLSSQSLSEYKSLLRIPNVIINLLTPSFSLKMECQYELIRYNFSILN